MKSLLSISSVLVTLLILIPMMTIFMHFSHESANFEHIKNTLLFEYIKNTIFVMIGVGFLTIFMGFFTAYLTSLYSFTFSRFFSFALFLPFAIPTYIMTFIYNGMFGISGSVTIFALNFFNKTLNEVPFYDIQSLPGVIFVISLVLYPYVYLICKSYLSFESSSIIEAAKTLNLNSRQIFFKLILPISRPAIVAGATLAIMEAVADFGAMDYFGVSTFTTGIFRTWEGLGSVEDASKLASILMFVLFFLIIFERFLRRGKNYKSSGKDFKPLEKEKLKGFKNFLAFFACFMIFFLGFLMPFTQLCYWFLISYEKIIDEEFLNLLLNTLKLGFFSAFLITSAALFLTFTLRIFKNKVHFFGIQAIKLGYAIPGAVVAVGILSFFGLLNVSFSILLSGSVGAVIFGLLVRFICVSINSLEAGFSRIPNSYDDVAKLANLSPLKKLKMLFLPLLKAPLFTSFVIVFIEVVKELPLTMILRPFNYDTLAIRAFELNEQSQTIESSVAAMFIVLLGIVLVIFLTKKQ